MTYTPRPNPSGDTLVASRDQIRTNFSLIQTNFDINHENFGVGANAGKHKFMQMPVQSSLPATATGDGELHTEADSSTRSQLFYSRDNTAATKVQLTTGDTSAATFSTNTNYQVGPPSINGGWSFLPGGLILQYGKVAIVDTTTVITYPLAFSAAAYSIIVTNSKTTSNTSAIVVSASTPTNFTIIGGSTSVYWQAIGK